MSETEEETDAAHPLVQQETPPAIGNEQNVDSAIQDSAVVTFEQDESGWLDEWYENECQDAFMTECCELCQDAFMAECWETDSEELCYNITFHEPSAPDSMSKGKPKKHMLSIDIGASETVVGTPWIRRRIALGKEDIQSYLKPSRKSFKFGSQEKFPSLGALTITGRIDGRDMAGNCVSRLIQFDVDVVLPPIPFLVSRETLKNMRASLDFSSCTLNINQDVVIDLIPSISGHLFMTISTVSNDTDFEHAWIFHGDDELSSEAIKKMHVQFGHADVATIARILRIGQQKAVEKTIQEVVQNCSCLRPSGPNGKPIVSRYLNSAPGQAIATDTFFLRRQVPNVALRLLPFVFFQSWYLLDSFHPATLADMFKF